jgi:hypothetical protein
MERQGSGVLFCRMLGFILYNYAKLFHNSWACLMCLQQSSLVINNIEDSVIIITILGPQFSKQSFQTICPVIVSLSDPYQTGHVSAVLLFFAEDDHGFKGTVA